MLTSASGRTPLVVDITPATYAPSTTGLGWLSSDRSGIVDQHGRKVLLRGFNTAAILQWPRQPVAPLDDLDAARLQLSLVEGQGCVVDISAD